MARHASLDMHPRVIQQERPQMICSNSLCWLQPVALLLLSGMLSLVVTVPEGAFSKARRFIARRRYLFCAFKGAGRATVSTKGHRHEIRSYEELQPLSCSRLD